jgi:hypothetical protein
MRILNERARARDIITSKTMVGEKKDTAVLLTKYYSELGEDCIKIKNNILDLFESTDPEFNRVLNSGWIERLVKANHHEKISEVSYIPVTQYELEKIASVKNLNMEKVLFVMLVCAKYDKKEKFNDYWYNEQVVNTGLQMFSELFRMAKVKEKKGSQLNILNSIVMKTNMVSMSNRPDRVGFKLNYIGGDKEVLRVESFDTYFINEYLKWKGYSLCSVCEDIIEKKHGSQRYCKACSKTLELEKYRKYNKKR